MSDNEQIISAPASTTNEIVVVTTAAPSANVETAEADVLTTQFNGVVNVLNGLKAQLTTVAQQIRALEKVAQKEIRALRKESEKRKLKSANRKPSGFAKPSKISAELAAFMQKDAGAEIARTEVTKYIIKYIRENNLQNAANRKIILPDEALTKLLDVKDNNELTYFNLQVYMNKHFQKS